MNKADESAASTIILRKCKNAIGDTYDRLRRKYGANEAGVVANSRYVAKVYPHAGKRVFDNVDVMAVFIFDLCSASDVIKEYNVQQSTAEDKCTWHYCIGSLAQFYLPTWYMRVQWILKLKVQHELTRLNPEWRADQVGGKLQIDMLSAALNLPPFTQDDQAYLPLSF